eukprot:1725190-Pyramimonas_sp.AAC.1
MPIQHLQHSPHALTYQEATDLGLLQAGFCCEPTGPPRAHARARAANKPSGGSQRSCRSTNGATAARSKLFH